MIIENCTRNISIRTGELIQDKENIWAFHKDINALFKCNLDGENGEYVCSLEEEKMIKEMLIGKMLIRNSLLFLLPMWGDYIHVYDIKTKRQHILHLREEHLYRSKMLFCEAFLYKDDIYCVPVNYRYLIKITNDNKIEYLFDLEDVLEKVGIDKVNFNRAAFDGRNIVAVQAGDNRYVEFNLESLEIKVKDVDREKMLLNSVEIIDGSIYLCGKNEEDKWEVFREEDSKIVFQSDDWITIRKMGENLLIDSITCDWFFIIDCKDGTQKKIEEPLLVKTGFYRNGVVSCDGIYYYSNRQGILKKYSDGYYIDIGELKAEFNANCMIKNKEVLREIECFQLADFIEIIKRKE